MKAVVGVDAKGAYRPAIALLTRLNFPKPTTTLLHVADPNLPFSDSVALDAAVQAEYARTTRELGLLALDGAKEFAYEFDSQPRLKMIFGRPAGTIIAEAESELADVVAVCATHTGMWSSSYLGSVSRALAISCTSTVLIAKGSVRHSGPMKAVFATDHSPFADRCLDRFLQLNPKGIDQINVVSAFEIDDWEAAILNKNLAMFGGDVDRAIQEIVDTSNATACDRLNLAGYATTSIAAKGNANDVIRQAMQNTRSDIVIVGAQGNGYNDRSLIGSVSLHQVVVEPYPVLIVRP